MDYTAFSTSARDPSADNLKFARVAAAVYAGVLGLALLLAVWRMPIGLSEVVGVLENVETQPLSELVHGSAEYVRPLFWMTVAAVWRGAPTASGALDAFRVLHVLSVAALLFVFVGACRLRHSADWIAVAVAMPVLIGTSAFRENLESLPLNPTIFACILALAACRLTEAPRRHWHDAAAVLLSVLAVGAKEQGLVVPAIFITAAFLGAPGISRRVAWALLIASACYGAVRLLGADDIPVFMRSLGYGYSELSEAEVYERFGAAPWVAYAYNMGATIGNVLFGEPSRGILMWTRRVTQDPVAPWMIVQALAYLGALVMAGVWAATAVIDRSAARASDRRAALVFVAALIVCTVLAFNYTRDRMAGPAAAVYALIVFRATSWWLAHYSRAGLFRQACAAAVLLLTASAWQVRAGGTLYYAHDTAWELRKEWLVDLGDRQRRFVGRDRFLTIMSQMRRQGSDASIPATPLPKWATPWVEYRW